MNVLLIIIICIFTVSAQTDYWPEVLKAPIPEEPRDSNKVDITLKQKLRNDIYKTNNAININRNDSIKRLEQKVSYELSDDNSLGLQNHYLDLSGLFLRKKIPFRFSSLGLEWAPTAAFNRRPDDFDEKTQRPIYSSNGIGSMRLGPVISIDYLNMPIHLSGGGAVDLWNPELPFNPGYHDVEEAKGDPGFYGSVRMGDNRKPLIEGIPFFAEGNIFGRYMNRVDNAKITNGEVNALFFNDVTFADTLFLYAADTLSKGRTAFLSEQVGGAARYSSTPDRTNNSLQAICGLKNFGNFFLKPSLAYTWAMSSVAYPVHEDIVGDERLMTHTISCMAKNGSAKIINYLGGISFTYENEDWLYKDEVSDTLTENNSDSLFMNLQDYKNYNLKMFHTIGREFTNSFGFNYSFIIRGYKKIYPNFYNTDYDTVPVRYVYDNDNVDLNHIIDVTLFSLPRIRVTTLFDYFKNKLVYLRKEMSAYNKAERTYRIEVTCNINPDSSSGLDGTIGAFAKTEEYHFPEYQENSYPMSRRFYSKLKGRLGINDRMLIEGIWSELYLDDGNYVDSVDILFLESQMLESTVELMSSYQFPNNFMLRIGSLFRYIYRDWQFPLKDRIYYMMPFVEMRAIINNRLFINARIERYMDPDADDHWEAFSLFNLMF